MSTNLSDEIREYCKFSAALRFYLNKNSKDEGIQKRIKFVKQCEKECFKKTNAKECYFRSIPIGIGKSYQEFIFPIG